MLLFCLITISLTASDQNSLPMQSPLERIRQLRASEEYKRLYYDSSEDNIIAALAFSMNMLPTSQEVIATRKLHRFIADFSELSNKITTKPDHTCSEILDLLAEGADPDALDPLEDFCPLYVLAARDEYAPLLHLFLTNSIKKANPNTQNNFEKFLGGEHNCYTPLHNAVSHGQERAIRILLSCREIDIDLRCDLLNRTPLELARSLCEHNPCKYGPIIRLLQSFNQDEER